jgi:hypothetical protein
MQTETTPQSPPVIASQHINYLDHIKVLLTVLVILHHTFITYGAPGGWYFKQPATNIGALIPMTLFVSINQSFFMGMFFFISAYFVPPSYDRKGPKVFLLDRLKRLGIPLVFYSIILSPVLNYYIYYFGYGNHISFSEYLSGYHNWIDFGVLWFVAALLVFTLIYVALAPVVRISRSLKLPGTGGIFLFAAILGLISFFVRQLFPVGWVLRPVGFQLGHFTQYIAMFCIGIIARKNNWLDHLSLKTARQCLWIAIIATLTLFPAMLFLWKTYPDIKGQFDGGWHIGAFISAMWEQITGISIMAALAGIAKQKWNRPSKFMGKLSRSAFAVYIFHPLVVVGITVAIAGWAADPVIKLLIAAPLVVFGSFVLGRILVSVPGVKRII